MYRASISFRVEGETEDVAVEALLYVINEFSRRADTEHDGLDGVKIEEVILCVECNQEKSRDSFGRGCWLHRYGVCDYCTKKLYNRDN